MVSRRAFLEVHRATRVHVLRIDRLRGFSKPSRRFPAERWIPSGSKYADSVADPAGDAAGRASCVRAATTVDYYEISMRQFTQQILPGRLATTTVWGYGPVKVV